MDPTGDRRNLPESANPNAASPVSTAMSERQPMRSGERVDLIITMIDDALAEYEQSKLVAVPISVVQVVDARLVACAA